MRNIENYIKYHKGDIPLIISVPHGGNLNVKNIPARSNGVIGIDKKTIELTLILIEEIKEFYRIKRSINKTPSYIISNVSRSKIDLNRIETEAYSQNSKLAKKIYRFYHNKIKELINDNLESFKFSLLIDIHGFEKNKRPEGFRDVELILGSNNLKTILQNNLPRKFWKQNIRGRIIKKFLTLGIPIAPGHPMRSEYVLTGGYITKQYGVSKINNSQTIQIEFSDQIRLYDDKLKSIVLSALAEVLCDEIFIFFDKNFGNKNRI
ncbi:MAG: hypothetical protein ACFE85_08030 [Candidatus Hodarchaeota archaeon]